MNVKIQLLHPRARVPEYAKPGDSGADLRAVESLRLRFGEPQIAWFGIALAWASKVRFARARA
jgi:dUTP pyrophosphatase